MKKTLGSLAVGSALLVALPAYAQFSKPEDAVRYRQSAMNLTGNHMTRIAVQLKSPTPNVQVIQSSAALIETLSKLQFEGFVPGTDNVGNTKAKPELFKDTAKVKDLIDKAQAEVVKLAATAKGGDVAAIRAQLGATGKACNNYHDDYRAK